MQSNRHNISKSPKGCRFIVFRMLSTVIFARPAKRAEQHRLRLFVQASALPSRALPLSSILHPWRRLPEKTPIHVSTSYGTLVARQGRQRTKITKKKQSKSKSIVELWSSSIFLTQREQRDSHFSSVRIQKGNKTRCCFLYRSSSNSSSPRVPR